MSIDQLEDIAQAMVAPGKGIIAIDESNATIKKRFDAVGIECTEDGYRGPARRVYAEAAFRERLACRSADAQTERRLREASVLLENAGVVESKRG